MPSHIHPTAVVAPEANLADDVTVGPFAIIEAGVTLAAGVVVGPHVHLLGLVEVGAMTRFHTGCVIGDAPQHMAYKGEPTRVVIGRGNTFREYVTVHRAMPVGPHATVIGDRNLFMVNAHVAHDCTVGDDCILANGAMMGGHSELGDRAYMSGNTAVHQFCRVGTLAMIGALSCVSQDLPPYWIVQGRMNEVRGVNVVGMRRAGVPRVEINAVRAAYKLLNRSGRTIPDALAEMEQLYPDLPAIRRIVEFIRSTKRSICTGHVTSGPGPTAPGDGDGDA